MKNALKKAISVLLVAVMIFGAAPLAGFVGLELPELNLFSTKAEAATYSGKCGDNLMWTLNTEARVLEISGTGSMYNWKNETSAPWQSDRSTIKRVVIEEGVTNIGDYAFYNFKNIVAINLPDTIETIGKYSFSKCNYVTNVTIPDSVKLVDRGAFISCELLEEITIGVGVLCIEEYAFGGCDRLSVTKYKGSQKQWEEIKIGSNNDNLNEHFIFEVFSDRPYYGSGFCGDDVSWIQYVDGEFVLEGAGEMLQFNQTGIVSPWKTKIKKLTISDKVTSIATGAFSGCTYLKDVLLPNSITEIGNAAFLMCSNLETIEIPDSVVTIGEDVFKGCSNLEKVIIGNGVKRIGSGAFAWCNNILFAYYSGTQKQWEEISISESGNGPLLDSITFEYTADKFEHNIIIDKGVEASCTKTGLTEGQHCSHCDDMTIEQEIIPALNHKDTLIQVEAKAPSCIEIGWDAYEYCTACDYTTYTEKSALNHDIIIDKAVDATCTETGLTKGQHCSRCDDMTVEQEIVPVKLHDYIAKHDSTKHWEECACGSKINVQTHAFIGGNTCSCGFKRVVDSAIKIRNNSGSKTINYGETLKLTTTVTDKPANTKIYWYVDGVKSGEGEVFNVKFENGTKIITVKLVDENGVVYQNASGDEITDSENVTVNSGFFQKIISFFKNLFGMNRTVVQTIFKGIY